MMTQESPIWIDTDNAMGSGSGDIDDAIAISALFAAHRPILGVSTVFGNTAQNQSFRNTQGLLNHFGYKGPCYAGANTPTDSNNSASGAISQITQPFTLLALGPLTNVAWALKKNPELKKWIKEIVFVGLNYNFRAPTWRFFDFNVWKDPISTQFVFTQGLPITVSPCNVARNVRMSSQDLKVIPGPLGKNFQLNSKRWFLRSKLLKFSNTIPVWDLCASLYVINPSLFQLKPAVFTKTSWGNLHLLPATNTNSIQSIVGFQRKTLQFAKDLLKRPISH